MIMPAWSLSRNTTGPATSAWVAHLRRGIMSRKGIFTRYSKQDKALARELMERTGIEHLRKKVIGELSGGQMQRVAITSNGMEIDLNAFSYYLEVAAVADLEDLEKENQKAETVECGARSSSLPPAP